MCLGHDPCRRGKTSTMRDCRDTQKTAVFTSNRGCCGHLTLCLGRDDRSIQFLQACFKGFPLAFSNFFHPFGVRDVLRKSLEFFYQALRVSVLVLVWSFFLMQKCKHRNPSHPQTEVFNVTTVFTSLILRWLHLQSMFILAYVKVRIIVGISHLYNHITI